MFLCQSEEKPCPLISTKPSRLLLHQGYFGYWYNGIDTQERKEKVEDNLVIYEFRDVFPEALPGLPPRRGIDFEIELP